MFYDPKDIMVTLQEECDTKIRKTVFKYGLEMVISSLVKHCNDEADILSISNQNYETQEHLRKVAKRLDVVL